MMTWSKSLDLDCFKLFSRILFRSKYCSKRLKAIFDEFDSEPIVTLVYKIMISAKCLHFQLFWVIWNYDVCKMLKFSTILSYFQRDWGRFLAW